ncbi:very short patch repair endonuclease [Pseudorhodoferax sp. Leaf265]|uniref:very short patch repair endonuclease n=1 Tax=Pseudorhodoferax sp. Leaf265 TaxID=1736315 RepID=UPI0006F9174F|nr:very short patch repair endonuclease [Pseudorhodoferax sp. Leaf265]KQP12063.1 hypothetical protein ASF45_32170 [Pseudorhodoferax sp. Leaf265]
MDSLTVQQRSERMALVRGKDTTPELQVRRLLWSLGYRYRLHGKDLPGRPDIVFRGRRRVIFVHGCMWHQHGCGAYKQPKSNVEFWAAKLGKNVERDQRHLQALVDAGWNVLVVWECELRHFQDLERRLVEFLERSPGAGEIASP